MTFSRTPSPMPKRSWSTLVNMPLCAMLLLQCRSNRNTWNSVSAGTAPGSVTWPSKVSSFEHGQQAAQDQVFHTKFNQTLHIGYCHPCHPLIFLLFFYPLFHLSPFFLLLFFLLHPHLFSSSLCSSSLGRLRLAHISCEVWSSILSDGDNRF